MAVEQRPYKDADAVKGVQAFIGVEVEETKFVLQKTLFIAVELHSNDIADILHDHKDVTHVYLGANQLYRDKAIPNFRDLVCLVKRLNYVGFNVTLDIPVSLAEEFYKHGSTLDSNVFCLMLSLMIPDTNRFTVIKADSKFGMNEGVSCLRYDRLDPSDRTTWDMYTQDIIVKEG